ncbi:MAG: hypothetical protein LLF89_01650 [Spirochaetaceae bacterium]|nr:hypothetical protein [Spirochaetaceae bacterium]
MAQPKHSSFSEVLQIISQGRERTNLLRKYEQKAIAFLVQRVPSWVSSDMLTGIGFMGNVLVCLSFVLGARVDDHYLLLGVVGFMISWFGDSLDGRIAYYRNSPRKWYGFSLDLAVDWAGIVLIGLGFMIYADNFSKFLGYAFVTLYGLEIIIALLRYKITGKYSIDSGIFGPTEVRILISIFMILEVIFNGLILYMAAIAVVILVVSNILEFRKLLRMADQRDLEERKQTEKEEK